MEIVKQLEQTVARTTLVFLAVVGLATMAVDRPLAGGLLIGGLAGLAAFGCTVRAAAAVYYIHIPAKGKTWTRLWGGVRLLIYAGGMLLGNRLDPGHWHGLAGAAAGLMVPTVVVMWAGITGADLKNGAV